MILETVNKTETNATADFQTFNIKASPFAFQILSGSLYSNKIRAIIRELSTNALDAHKEAGKADIPFKVTIPTYEDCIFEIRDFGTGLSEEDLFSIYTTFFDSTKRNTNDLTGCLGLGSKTPFSYTQAFTITSYFNNEKKVYIAALKDGIPNIAKVSTESTTEDNGLSIKFAVESKDRSDFNKEAQYVYTFFRVKPDINITLKSYPIKDETDEYIIMDMNNSYHGYEHIMIEQGSNVYPLSSDKVTDAIRRLESFVEINRYSSKYCVILKSKIGDMSITPSREELHYDDKTVANVNKLVDNFCQTVKANIDRFAYFVKTKVKLEYINERVSNITAKMDCIVINSVNSVRDLNFKTKRAKDAVKIGIPLYNRINSKVIYQTKNEVSENIISRIVNNQSMRNVYFVNGKLTKKTIKEIEYAFDLLQDEKLEFIKADKFVEDNKTIATKVIRDRGDITVYYNENCSRSEYSYTTVPVTDAEDCLESGEYIQCSTKADFEFVRFVNYLRTKTITSCKEFQDDINELFECSANANIKGITVTPSAMKRIDWTKSINLEDLKVIVIKHFGTIIKEINTLKMFYDNAPKKTIGYRYHGYSNFIENEFKELDFMKDMGTKFKAVRYAVKVLDIMTKSANKIESPVYHIVTDYFNRWRCDKNLLTNYLNCSTIINTVKIQRAIELYKQVFNNINNCNKNYDKNQIRNYDKRNMMIRFNNINKNYMMRIGFDIDLID